MLKKIELLSPAGTLTKLKYSLAYGADAVYLSYKEFGMRNQAKNFNISELKKAVNYAHLMNKKIYLAANILLRNNHIKKIILFLQKIKNINIDGIIISDMGLLKIIKKEVPNFNIHISTQMSVTNYETANFLFELGVKRIILSRELSLNEIIKIRKLTNKNLELEVFIHGSMCMSYSGRCLISNFLLNRNANHGKCAQPCRWQYNLIEKNRPDKSFPIFEDKYGTYILNSKDLCMIDHIPKLIKSGINSLKIEGRNKTEYYTSIITNAYRKSIDAYYSKNKDINHFFDIKKEVNAVSHRRYCTGFFFKDNIKNNEYYNNSNYIMEYNIIATFIKNTNKFYASFELKNLLKTNNILELIQPNQPIFKFKVEEIYDKAFNLISCANKPTMIINLKFNFKIKPFSFLRMQK